MTFRVWRPRIERCAEFNPFDSVIRDDYLQNPCKLRGREDTAPLQGLGDVSDADSLEGVIAEAPRRQAA